IAARLCHVGGAGHAGRTGSDDADAQAVGFDIGNVGPAFGNGQVADEALEPTDCHRLQRLTDRADAFALRLLRTDPTADGRQEIGVGDDVVGAAVILLCDLLYEVGNVDADRTTAH